MLQIWYHPYLSRYFEGMTDARERSPWSAAASAQIRAERAAKRWSQVEMAERTGIPRSTYLRLETGTRVPDITQLARICGALGMSLEDFLGRVSERVPKGS